MHAYEIWQRGLVCVGCRGNMIFLPNKKIQEVNWEKASQGSLCQKPNGNAFWIEKPGPNIWKGYDIIVRMIMLIRLR